jgi:hypothetical protein
MPEAMARLGITQRTARAATTGLLTLAFTLAFAACTEHLTRPPIHSTIPLTSTTTYTTLGPANGHACSSSVSLLFIPIVGESDTQAEAIRNAYQLLGGDGLMDAQVSTEIRYWTSLLINWEKICTDVRGTAIRLTKP